MILLTASLSRLCFSGCECEMYSNRAILRHDIGWFDKEENAVGALTTQLEEDTAKVHCCTPGKEQDAEMEITSKLVLNTSFLF